MATRKSTKPTILQQRFCQILHSMKKPNKLKALQLAGSCMKGETGRVEAERTLQKPHVAAYFKKLSKRAESRAEKKADEIIAELEKIGFSNIQDFIADSNEIKDISEISRDKAAAVKSIQTDIRHDGGDSDGYTEKVKITLYDKKSALVDLGKRFNIFPNTHDVNISGEIILKPPQIT